MRFQDRVLVCTGAASGMGQAVARRFAAEGGKVALVDVNGEGLSETAADIEGTLVFKSDIRDPDEVDRVFRDTNAHFGGIDCLYNGAGVLSYVPLVEQSREDIARVIDINLMGTLQMCRSAIPYLRESKHAAIVNTVSVSALIAYPLTAAYAASKGGVLSITRTLAGELGPTIRVNSISPGRTITGMTSPRLTALGDGDVEKGMKIAGADVMLKRVARPSEMAAAVCFLLSDDASYITAVDVPVDGGLTAW